MRKKSKTFKRRTDSSGHLDQIISLRAALGMPALKFKQCKSCGDKTVNHSKCHFCQTTGYSAYFDESMDPELHGARAVYCGNESYD